MLSSMNMLPKGLDLGCSASGLPKKFKVSDLGSVGLPDIASTMAHKGSESEARPTWAGDFQNLQALFRKSTPITHSC